MTMVDSVMLLVRQDEASPNPRSDSPTYSVLSAPCVRWRQLPRLATSTRNLLGRDPSRAFRTSNLDTAREECSFHAPSMYLGAIPHLHVRKCLVTATTAPFGSCFRNSILPEGTNSQCSVQFSPSRPFPLRQAAAEFRHLQVLHFRVCIRNGQRRPLPALSPQPSAPRPCAS